MIAKVTAHIENVPKDNYFLKSARKNVPTTYVLDIDFPSGRLRVEVDHNTYCLAQLEISRSTIHSHITAERE